MLLNRLEFTLILEVINPLTIGTGAVIVDKKDETRNEVEIHKDGDGNAYIPATSLKGALRAKYKGYNEGAIFGEIKGDSTGSMGQLLLYAATSINHTETSRPTTAINRKTGTADKGKLFSVTGVDEGSVFCLHGCLMLDTKQENPESLLAGILAPLHAGLSLGKGSKLGLGRVKVKQIDKICLQEINKTALKLTSKDVKKAYETALIGNNSPPFTKAVEFTLTCAGAYISIGKNEKTDKGNHIKYRQKKGEPELLPSSLYGVMRSRAAWLLELEQIRLNKPPQEELDRRFNYHLEKKEEIEHLTSLERLFGVSGFKGVLQIETIKCTKAGKERHTTHIAIDRLTGGSLNGALYEVEAVEDCAFDVILSYSNRMENNANKANDKVFFKHLIDDLTTNGIMLGYGASKGYGWFKVENVIWL